MMIRQLQSVARNQTSNENCVRAFVAFSLFLSRAPGDIAGAMNEAAYDLDVEDAPEFEQMMAAIAA